MVKKAKTLQPEQGDALKQYTTNTATVTITITLVNGTKLTKSCIVSFIWSAPAIGDFAYIDGTFSPGYDENKTIVGIVYAVEPTTDTSGTVYIIGKEYSNTVNFPYRLPVKSSNNSHPHDCLCCTVTCLSSYITSLPQSHLNFQYALPFS